MLSDALARYRAWEQDGAGVCDDRTRLLIRLLATALEMAGRETPKRIGGSNQLLNMRELAEYIARPLRTVERKHAAWKIPGRKRHGRWEFRLRDVDAWIEARKDETPGQ